MALTQEGRELTDSHRRAQLLIKARALQDFKPAWSELDLDDLSSFDKVASEAQRIVRGRRDEASDRAMEYLTEFRRAEGLTGDPPDVRAEPVDDQRLKRGMRSSGYVGVLRSLKRGHGRERARQNGLVRASGALERYVHDGGRETLQKAVQADQQAVGWQRVTGSEPCAFCALLASRGAVYKEDTVDFEAHDHCDCESEVVYADDEAAVREENKRFERMYNDAVRKAEEAGELRRGTSNDLLNAFRREYERGAAAPS